MPPTDGAVIDRYPTTATADDHDRFDVTVNGGPVFVETLAAPGENVYYEFPGATDLSYGVAQFALAEGADPVDVSVDAAGGPIDPDSVRLRPRVGAPEYDVDGSRISFAVGEPRTLLLEIGSDWLFLFVDPPRPVPPDPDDPAVVDVRTFDVNDTGTELATKGLQEAIVDAATGPHPDGTVYVPPGVYRTGTLDLYGGVTLFLAPGALLQASPDPADFPLPFGADHGPPGRDLGYDYALLRVHDCDGASVVGRGIIDGAGRENGRLKLVHVAGSRDITLRGITARNGHGWMIPILDSADVLVENVKATNFGNRRRDAVRNITVEGCTLLTLKSALKVGTETRADLIEDVTFRDVDVLAADRTFTVYLRDGATVRDVTFEDVRVERPGSLRDDRDRLIDVSIEPRDRDVVWQRPDWDDVRDDPGRIRGLTFSEVRVDTTDAEHLATSRIAGHDAANDVDGVAFEGVSIDGEAILDPDDEITVAGESFPFLSIDEGTVRNVTFGADG